MTSSSLADIHCHLSFPEFDEDREQVIERLREAGVGLLIDPGTCAESSRRSIELADRYDFIYANVGLHPHEVTAQLSPDRYDELETLARSEKVVGIGEIGLDYHWPDHHPEAQQEAFREMLRMATRLDLPVVIHCRDAWPDMLRILGEERSSALRGAMHCFSGDIEMAQHCIELGLKLSIPGIVTYKKSTLPEVVQAVGLDDLLSETDAPYLAPVPKRGKRNEPAFVKHTVNKIADLRPEPFEEVTGALFSNAKELFAIA
ncbi:hydrolase, TatD family [Chlorobaculum parvum NCIB 8327]|uniref:Hydrolase, TatD family n=1 Tax=Chlorobaculum parvum (strain DSM 263 / NCIMB 8327) TaxID=517417 RepID=B3QQ43_CHLP8|nr:TatD family hydrolase [Chlorobaculum parvum]ACF12046.1 hydrolase, TatD family [Chlorobaculum parvum NCIB 8327]